MEREEFYGTQAALFGAEGVFLNCLKESEEEKLCVLWSENQLVVE